MIEYINHVIWYTLESLVLIIPVVLMIVAGYLTTTIIFKTSKMIIKVVRKCI